jgi:hypothetical protein
VPELVEGDGISTRERKLLRLYGLGLATRQQRAAIKPAIEADPTCARFVRDMVETSRGAAALLPPPGAVEVADVGIVERAIAPLAQLKERMVGSISDAAGAPANVRRASLAFPRWYVAKNATSLVGGGTGVRARPRRLRCPPLPHRIEDRRADHGLVLASGVRCVLGRTATSCSSVRIPSFAEPSPNSPTP